MVKWLLDISKGKKDAKGADLVVKQLDTTLFTSLLRRGKLDSAKWLLEISKGKKDAKGADLVVKQLDTTLFTSLLRRGKLDSAKWLLEISKGEKDAKGADLVVKQLTAVDERGMSLFAVLVETENFGSAKWLLEQFEGKRDLDGSDLVLKQLTAVYGTNLKCLIEASELFPVVLDVFHSSVDKLPNTLSDPFKKALGLKERPSASEFYCALALLEEPSKLISDQITEWNVLRDDALKLPNKGLCIRATCALKKLMADPSRLVADSPKC